MGKKYSQKRTILDTLLLTKVLIICCHQIKWMLIYIIKMLLPTKRQWKNWSLPSKLTLVGTYTGIIGLFISIVPSPLEDVENGILQSQLKNQIITEISNVVQRCETVKNIEKGYGPNTTSLILHDTKAIPIIFNFIAESVQIDIDQNNPYFLLNFRKKLINTPAFNCLVYAILEICKNDSSKEYQNYFQELLFKKDPSVRDIKKTLLLSYILWNFNDSKLVDIQDQLLIEDQPPVYDSVKKVLLRSYLFRNEEFFPIHLNMGSTSTIESKDFFSNSSEVMISHYAKMSEIIGIQSVCNWQNLLFHIYSYEGAYNSFYEVSGANTRIFLAQKNQSRFRSCLDRYLFGYDFFDMKLKYLDISRVLLGKSFFHKSLLEHFRIQESNFIECQIHDSEIKISTINNTIFDYCDFNGSELGRFSIFDTTIFQDSLFTDSSFPESLFYKCKFSRCQIKNLKAGASIFIDCEFENNAIDTITLDHVFMDESSMINLFEKTVLSRDDFEIEIVGYSNTSTSDRNSAAIILSLQASAWEMYNPKIVRDYIEKVPNNKKFFMITSKCRKNLD